MPADLPDDAVALYPDAGTLRVHPDPGWLAPAEPENPGSNRFDDPLGYVAVRYSATRLVGCLLETMSRFRRHGDAEERLAQIEGLEEGDVEYDAGDPNPLRLWLSAQRVGTIQLDQLGDLIHLESDTMLRLLDKHPGVRAAISVLDPEQHLDVALLRLSGRKLGRPISQAVGVAVRENYPGALGVGYRSRFSTDEPCYAIWESTSVSVQTIPLDPSNAHHREAVGHVAARFELALPEGW